MPLSKGGEASDRETWSRGDCPCVRRARGESRFPEARARGLAPEPRVQPDPQPRAPGTARPSPRVFVANGGTGSSSGSSSAETSCLFLLLLLLLPSSREAPDPRLEPPPARQRGWGAESLSP